MSSRGRALAIAAAVLVLVGAGVMWEVGLSGAPTPDSLSSGSHWRLLSHGATNARVGSLTAVSDSSGLVVRFVSTGPQNNCDAPTLRSVIEHGGRAVVRLQWAGRGCADTHRGETFELRFTSPAPAVVTFELVDTCARWDVSTPDRPVRLGSPKQNLDGDCPI